jgi:hypothetical protein
MSQSDARKPFVVKLLRKIKIMIIMFQAAANLLLVLLFSLARPLVFD